jgi:glycosyltransferase involved in cell wall biosynthesis
MRILFVLSCFPYPPHDGRKIKVFNILSFMGQRHDCDLIAFDRAPETCDVRALKAACPGLKNVALHRERGGPLLRVDQLIDLLMGGLTWQARYRLPAFAQEIRATIQANHYDAIHVDEIGLTQGLPDMRENGVLSINDCTTLVYRYKIRAAGCLSRIFFSQQLKLVARLEKSLHQSFRVVHVVTERDARYLRRLNPDLRVEVIPISLQNNATSNAGQTTPEVRPKNVLTIGDCNTTWVRSGIVAFMLKAWPKIYCNIPGARLTVLARPTDRGLLKAARQVPACTLLSYVSNYAETLNQADVIVIPDEGGAGMKNRVLEVMALGKPCALSLDAARGFEFDGVQDRLLFRDMDECVGKVTAFLSDPVQAASIGAHLKSVARRHYSFEAVGQRWEMLYLGLRPGQRSGSKTQTGS